MEGVKDVQGGTVRACAPGLHGGGDEHAGGCPGVRSAPGHGAQDAGVLGATRVPSTVTGPSSQAGPIPGVIDRILEEDCSLPKKQRHTAKRIYERLRAEHSFTGKYTIVKGYVRERRRRTREMYVPLSHPAGHAQCDFGQAKAVIGGVEQTRPLLRAGPSPQRRALRQGLPRRDDRGVLRRSRLGVLVPGRRAAEHLVRQHEVGGGQDPGRRPAPAYSCVLGARVPLPVRGLR